MPDGTSVPGVPLAVTHAAGGDMTLSWGSGCGGGISDYEIYEGTLGLYYSHASKFCSTGGLTTKTFTPPAGGAYYLVVPRNALREGSYGTDSAAVQRPAGMAACLAREAAACP